MDSEKLIERLRTESLYADKASLEIMDLCMEAATAISTLRAENEKLRAELEQVKQCVDGKPAADVAPVRHGRWMTTDAYPHHLYCSVCYKTYAKNAKWVNELDLPTNYCPNCGALMEKKEDEHD